MRPGSSTSSAPYPDLPEQPSMASSRLGRWLDASASRVLIMPAVLIVLVFAVFPLIVSLYLSLSRFQFVRGGFTVNFIGFTNFNKLLFGSEQRRFLGRFAELSPLGIILLALFFALLAWMLFSYIRSSRFTVVGLISRLISILIAGALAILVGVTLFTVDERGLPGTLVVTLIFVFVGVGLQYLIGLGLAMLLTQDIPGKRFFRIVFLLPMMITPVGVGFLFRMVVDTLKGPIAPIWVGLGLADFSWVDSAHTARLAVIIGDTWQWTPFMFIILLAALEGVSRETIEAALVDGANRANMFRFIILPEIIPVSITVILIRMIEAFKIIDMPNVLTGGGPGTATESVTLQAYISWRSLDLGLSAALAYLLLFVVTFCALVLVNFVRRRLMMAGT